MSLFSDAMETGNAALLYQTGDLHAYWPAGIEADAVSIPVIWTDLQSAEHSTQRGKEEIAQAEAQVKVSDIAAPKVRHDRIIHGTAHYVVDSILETVGGMHRLLVELTTPTVRGSGRGR